MGCPDAQNTNRDMNTARSALKNTLTNMLKSGRKDSTNPNTERKSNNQYKRTSATRRASKPDDSNSGTRKNSVARSRNNSVMAGTRRSSCNNNNSATPTPIRGRSSTSDGRDSVHSDAGGGVGGGGRRKSISDEIQVIKGKNNTNLLVPSTLHTIPENENTNTNTSSQMNVRNSTTPSNMPGIESIRVATNDDGNNDDQPLPSQRNNLYNAIGHPTKATGNNFGIESQSTVPVIPNKILDGVRMDGSLRIESFSNSSSPLLQKDSKRVLLEPLDLEKQKKTAKKK